MKKTVCIFTFAVTNDFTWDIDSIYKGISGSEEAVIYMSQCLVKLGFRVFVFGNPPLNSPHRSPTANPCFLKPNEPIPRSIDIAIAWRMPQIGSDLRKIASKVYLWPHDTLGFSVTQEQVEAFDDVLWLSEWQRTQWMSVSPSFEKFTKIFGNGIQPEQFQPISPRSNPFSCIYGSNYGRGLEILLDSWWDVFETFPKATLDIYYGWQHWGTLTKAQEDVFKNKIKALPNVREHGQVSHHDLNRAYESSSLWTYPCTMDETFCITALRAQMAGAIPVVIQGSALTDVVRHGYSCLSKEEYLPLLKKALSDAEKISMEERAKMGEFILKEFTWEHLAMKWDGLFTANKTF